MKSSRRHELQQNALRNEMLKTWDLIRAKGNYIAWGALVAAVIIFAVFYFVTEGRKKAARTQADFAKAVAMAPGSDERLDSLKILADKDSPEWLAAGANVEVGNEYAFRLALNWPKSTEAERKQQAENARTYYQRVMDKFSKQDIAVAKAQLGLGKLDETFGDYTSAKKHYQDLLQMESLKGNPILAVAEGDYSNIAQLFTGKILIATTAPAEEPTSQPTTASAPAPSETTTAPAATPAATPTATPTATPAATPAMTPAASTTAPTIVQPTNTPAPSVSPAPAAADDATTKP